MPITPDPIGIELGLAVTTNVTGQIVKLPDYSKKDPTIQLYGEGVFTVDIEASLDGENWYSVATKTASEIFTVIYAPYFRMVTTGTTGSVDVWLKT